MSKILVNVISLLKSRKKGQLRSDTFFATVELDKREYCQKCFGNMKEDQNVGWRQYGGGNIAGWDVYTYRCELCGHEHEILVSRD